MKKATKAVLTAGVLLCVLGGGLYAIGRYTGGKEYVKNADAENSKMETVTLDKKKLEKIQKMEADIEDADFEIEPSKDDSFYLSYNLEKRKGKNPLTYEVEEGVLKLTEEGGYDSSVYVHVDLNYLGKLVGDKKAEVHKNVITLYVPAEKPLEDCKLSLGDADMSIVGLRSKNTDISSSWGDLTIKNSEFDNSTISTGDGDMNISDLVCKELNLCSESGDIQFKGSELDNAVITLNDGDLQAKEVTLSGEVTIKDETGDVDISLAAESAENTEIEARTEWGDIVVSKSLDGTKYSDDYDDTSEYQRHIKTAVGYLNIRCEDGDISIK